MGLFDEEMLSLAGLAREIKARNYTRAERYARSELAQSVSALLEYYDAALVRGPEEMAPIQDEASGPLSQFAPITSDVLWFWESTRKSGIACLGALQ